MKILYLTHRLPYPPNKGDKIRSYNVLAHLARRHEVWCVCFLDDPADHPGIAVLRGLCRAVHAVPLSRPAGKLRGLLGLAIDETATECFYRSRAMTRLVRELGAQVQFDAVLAFSAGVAQYARQVPARRHVLDLCDLDSRKWAAWAARRRGPASWLLDLEARRLLELETSLYESFDATILIGAHEAVDWHLPHQEKLYFMPNGVELPPLAPPAGGASGVVGFVGDMRYFPNEDAVIWFADRCWPTIRDRVPAAQLHIVGRGPTRAVRRLGHRTGIAVLGEVPQVLPHLQRFQVAIAPLRLGRGVQNKVLEALAAARATVATPLAATGLQAVPGRDLLVAEEATFAERVIGLLDDPAACTRLGDSARRYVLTHHDWKRALAPLDDLLSRAPSAPHPAALAPRASCPHPARHARARRVTPAPDASFPRKRESSSS